MSNNIFISSFIAGSVQTILGHPFDTLKTRMQNLLSVEHPGLNFLHHL